MSDSVRLKWLLTESDVRAGAEARDLPLLSVSISWGVRRRESADMTTRAASEDLSKYKLCRAGDLVINRMRAFQGALGIAPEDGVVSPDYAVLRVDPRVDKRWLNYLLTSGFTVATMASLVRGIGGTEAGNVRTPRLNVSDLQSMTVPFVAADEQRAIADYLHRETARIDTLIEEQQILVGLLAERRVAVMAEPFGQEYPTVPLGSALEELIDHRGKTPGKVGEKTDDFTDEGVPVVSAIHIKNGQISWDERERFVPYWMFEKWMPVRLRAGDVLLTSEAPLGNVAQVTNDAPLVLSQRLFALRSREDVLDSTYLRYFLESDRGQALLRDGASGSTVAGIRQSRLVQIPVPVPPLDEQRQVAQQIKEQIAKIDTLIAEAELFIELSKERRSALITAAVTGQIDVREMV
ncbi:restriction endonuclease subunit S [Gordonia terrae]|uniref:restriction endonuclease subunit S n=1 Tax=Gordonia terrae TaxID=2055 RepID=UPI003F6BBCAA